MEKCFQIKMAHISGIGFYAMW